VERSFLDRANARDLSAQAFYRLMEATWVHQAVARYALTFVSAPRTKPRGGGLLACMRACGAVVGG
jgi:hypothetical protein